MSDNSSAFSDDVHDISNHQSDIDYQLPNVTLTTNPALGSPASSKASVPPSADDTPIHARDIRACMSDIYARFASFSTQFGGGSAPLLGDLGSVRRDPTSAPSDNVRPNPSFIQVSDEIRDSTHPSYGGSGLGFVSGPTVAPRAAEVVRHSEARVGDLRGSVTSYRSLHDKLATTRDAIAVFVKRA